MDWVQLRKSKRATVSLTAVSIARDEAGKAGISLERFLSVWCSRGSQGLEASWLKPHERASPRQTESFAEADARKGMERWEQQTGRKHPDLVRPGTVIDITPRMELSA